MPATLHESHTTRRLDKAVLPVAEGLFYAAQTTPHDAVKMVASHCKPSVTVAEILEQDRRVQAQRDVHMQQLQEQQQQQQERDLRAEQALDRRDALCYELSVSFRMPSTVTEVLTFVKEAIGATGVYLGEVVDAGGPQERIEYLAVSKGHEFLLGKQLMKNQGLVWGCFQPPPEGEPEAAPPAHVYRPEPSVEWRNRATPEQGRALYVRDVLADPQVHFYQIPRPGEFAAVPIVFHSPCDVGAVLESMRGFGKAITSRRTFDESLLSGGTEEKKDKKDDKKKKDKKDDKKKKKKQEEEQPEDAVEHLDDERFFDLEVPKIEPKRLCRWVLCADTVGDQPRPMTVGRLQQRGPVPDYGSRESSRIEADRVLLAEHRQLLADVAYMFETQAPREATVQAQRCRDYFYAHNKGVLQPLQQEIEQQRDAKLENLQPAGTAAPAAKKKGKDDKKKKGKEAAQQEEGNDEDVKAARRVHLEACLASGRLFADELLQKRHALLLGLAPPATLDLLFALGYGFLREELTEPLLPHVAKQLLTPTLVQHLEKLHEVDRRPLHLSAIKPKLDALVTQDLAELSCGLDNTVKWVKVAIEQRDALHRKKAELAAPSDVRVLAPPPPEEEEEPGAALPAWLKELAGKHKWDLAPLGVGLVPLAADLPPREGHANPATTLILEAGQPIMDEDWATLKNWVLDGNHLVVLEDESRQGANVLNNLFGWQTQVTSTSDDLGPAGVTHDVVHMFELTPDEVGMPWFQYPQVVHPTSALCAAVVARPETVTGLLGASLPAGAVPVVETRVVDALVVPEGLGRVLVSLLPAESLVPYVAPPKPPEPTSPKDEEEEEHDPEPVHVDQALLRALCQLHEAAHVDAEDWDPKVFVQAEFQPNHSSLGEPSGEPDEEQLPEPAPVEECLDAAAVYTFSQPTNWASGTSFDRGVSGQPLLWPSVYGQGGWARATQVEVEPGLWGSGLRFGSDQSRLEAELPAPELAPLDVEAWAAEGAAVDACQGWTVSLWVQPTRKCQRNPMLLALIDAPIPLEVRITADERLLLWSGENPPEDAGEDYEVFSQQDEEDFLPEELKRHHGTGKAFLKFGHWNHIVVRQHGMVRACYLNGRLQQGCTHVVPKPKAHQVSLLQKCLAASATEGVATAVPPVRLQVSGPLLGETPTPLGPFDVEPGTGQQPFRGLAGSVAFWHRALTLPQVRSLYLRGRASNLWHPRRRVGPTAGAWDQSPDVVVWPRGGGPLPAEVVEYVRRGGSLMLTPGPGEVAHANAAFGWELETTLEAPGSRAAAVDVPSSYKTPGQWHVLDHCPHQIHAESGGFVARSCPPLSKALYGWQRTDAFTVEQGDGDVSFVGYHGWADSPPVWRTVLQRLIRGQTKFDL